MDGAPTGRRRRLAIAVGIASLLPLAGCGVGHEKEPPAATRPVTTSPAPAVGDGSTVLIGERQGAPAQLGAASVRVTVESVDHGEVTTTAGVGGLRALAFPRYVDKGAYPRAVVVVSNTGGTDELNPGEKPFTWGADFRIDTPSAGRAEDNGDNLIQRGLYSEPAEYKAELDLDRPACTVRGDDGVVTIRGPAIVPGLWYHMECRRRGYELTVTSWPLDQPEAKSRRTGFGPMGDVTPADPGVPLSVGGKVSPDHSILKSSTDEFNGDIAGAFLRISDDA